eukprot:jgi/Botrbrau1/16831/Bobra.150_2s0055.1
MTTWTHRFTKECEIRAWSAAMYPPANTAVQKNCHQPLHPTKAGPPATCTGPRVPIHASIGQYHRVVPGVRTNAIGYRTVQLPTTHFLQANKLFLSLLCHWWSYLGFKQSFCSVATFRLRQTLVATLRLRAHALQCDHICWVRANGLQCDHLKGQLLCNAGICLHLRGFPAFLRGAPASGTLLGKQPDVFTLYSKQPDLQLDSTNEGRYPPLKSY